MKLSSLTNKRVVIYKMMLYISSYIPIFIMIFINKMERLNFASIFKTIQGNFNFWILIIFISGICLIIISDF
ncbi:hypothetical protein, partial [Staphylococcus pseudintermedius]